MNGFGYDILGKINQLYTFKKNQDQKQIQKQTSSPVWADKVFSPRYSLANF